MGAARSLFEQEQALYAPQRERELEQMENRLVAQGMFGASGGAEQMGEIRKAHMMQDVQRQQDALKRVQGLIDLYRGREAEDIEAASALAAQPIKLAELGRGIGSGLEGVVRTGMGTTSAAMSALGATQTMASKENLWKSIFS